MAESAAAGGSRVVDTSPSLGDEVKYTTCYMCACRCGIKVHLKDGSVRYIEGNRDHPVNKGVLCAKGAAGIMQLNSPARLSKPLKRVGERGSGEFKEIEWEEALDTATAWLARARATDPHRLAFFTGRDQSQSLTSWWAQQFGTPNYAVATGFAAPLVLTLAAAVVSPGLLMIACAGLAAVSVGIGILIERWLFFAEAKHVVILYYGGERA